MRGGETTPRSFDIEPTGDELRIQHALALSELVLGDPHGHGLLAKLPSPAGQKGQPRHPEEPGARVVRLSRDVRESAPGDEEDLGGDVLGVSRVDATFEEAQDGRATPPATPR